jgi:hypothetical protein
MFLAVVVCLAFAAVLPFASVMFRDTFSDGDAG